jgi:hypothetical protein
MAEEHNRLDSQFNVVGAFWAPETIENVRTGTLRADEREITFTTAPEYTRAQLGVPIPLTLPGSSPREKMVVLHGFTEDGLCTLCDLMELNRPGLAHHGLGQSVVAITYRVSACVTGMHIGGSQDKCLKSARYTFSGLSDWLPKAASEKWDQDYITLKIPFKPQELLDFSVLESRARVTLKVFSQLTSSLADGGRISKPVAYVDVETPEPESLIWYYEIGNRLENLFSLLTGASLALDTFFVYRGEENGHVNSKRSSHAKSFDPRDCVWCTSDQLANCIALWFSESREFRRVESLVLGVVRKGKLFVETEFLSLAQALEGIHRVTEQISTPKKVVFASRLNALCKRISAPLLQRMGIDPDQFVKDVRNTRNFHTHTGSNPPSHTGTPISGKDLFLLSQKMRALLRGVLLLHLGLPEAQVSDVLEREATRWH